MAWTYHLHGRPGAPLGVETLRQDGDPGHVLAIERRDDPGVCDGYWVRRIDHDNQVAEYDWIIGGTPELVMPALVGRARGERN